MVVRPAGITVERDGLAEGDADVGTGESGAVVDAAGWPLLPQPATTAAAAARARIARIRLIPPVCAAGPVHE
jgi:hypothetical protein